MSTFKCARESRSTSPPDVSGPYTSGFEEEFETSIQRRLKEGRPEISLFFKKIDPAFLSDPGKDLKKVLAFKEKLIAEKKLLFEGFADIPEFQTKIRRCIWNYVRGLRDEDSKDASVKNQAPTAGGERQQAAEAVTSQAETPLSPEGAKFLREFVTKTEEEAAEAKITAVEVARFRLLSSLVGTHGNDRGALGVHDANLIFTKGGKFKLGFQEINGLVISGFQNYANQSTPLWRWFAAVDGFANKSLHKYSVIGSDTKTRGGALACMRLIAEPLPGKKRNSSVQRWLGPNVPSDLKILALAYLGDYGIAADLPSIRKEFDKGDNKTLNVAAEAIVRINLKQSREKGVDALFELQPTSINPQILNALFEAPASLSTDSLKKGVDHRASEVRRNVVKLLRARKALSDEMAELLMGDSDAIVRYEALMSRVDNGLIVSDADAKEMLVTRTDSANFATGGLGLISASVEATAAQCLAQFRELRLHALNDKDLEGIVAASSMYDSTAENILTERQFHRRVDELRQCIGDQYKAWFSRMLDTMIEKYGSTSPTLIDRARNLEEYTRKKRTRSSLDIICRKGDASDLALVRSTLKSGFIGFSKTDIEFLRRFGEWEDIALIIAAVKVPQVGLARSLLSSGNEETKYQAAARAIYTLGRNRLPELFLIDQPSELLCYLIGEISENVFRGLNDELIFPLLRSEVDRLRKIVALKCVRTLSKARLRKLLDAYISSGTSSYYNVIHWLDFGISVPRTRAFPATERMLNEELHK